MPTGDFYCKHDTWWVLCAICRGFNTYPLKTRELAKLEEVEEE